MRNKSCPPVAEPFVQPLRVGLFGIGLDAYWPQFAGLKERLDGYVARVAGKLGRQGVEVVNLGLVDNADRAYAAGREFRRADVDIIFLHERSNRCFRIQTIKVLGYFFFFGQNQINLFKTRGYFKIIQGNNIQGIRGSDGQNVTDFRYRQNSVAEG